MIRQRAKGTRYSARLRALPLFLTVFLFILPSAQACAPGFSAQTPPELIRPVEAPADIVRVRLDDIRPVKVAEGIVIPYSLGLSFRVPEAPISAIHVTHGQAVSKGDLLAELDTGAWLERLDGAYEELAHANRVSQHEAWLADIGLESAQIALDNAVDAEAAALAALNIQELALREAVRRETQELDFVRINNRIAVLESQKDGYAIYAPFDGVILNIEPQKIGDYPSGRAPFIYIADLNRLTLRSLTEQTSFFASAESVVAVVGEDEWPVKIIPYTLEEQLAFYYEGITPPARFEFDGADGAFAEGAAPPTDKRVLLMSYEPARENVLTIPINAAHIETASDEEGLTSRQDFAYVDINGVRERRDIKCGKRSEIKIEIVEGLTEGEYVYVD